MPEHEKVKLFGLSFKDLLAVWREGPIVIYLIGSHKVEHTCDSEAAAEEYATFLAAEWQKVLERQRKEREKRWWVMDSVERHLRRMQDEMDEGEEWKKDDDDN